MATWHAPARDVVYTFDPRFVAMLLDADTLRVQTSYGIYSPGGNPRYHYGIDVDTNGVNIGVKVRATVGGKVIMSTIVTNKNDRTWEWGHFICILDAQGYRHYFCHLHSRAVSVGQVVKAGDYIGVMGKTGNAAYDSQAEHVHYEVRKSPYGTYNHVDPTPWLGILNMQGWAQLKGNDPVKGDTDKMYCFDVAEKDARKLELFRASDVNAVFEPVRKLPAGKSILLKEVVLKNMNPGFSNKGAYIELEGTHERVYVATGLGYGEIVQNDTQYILDRFYPNGGGDGVPQAEYDAMVKDRDTQKAAKEAEQKKNTTALAYVQQGEAAMQQGEAAMQQGEAAMQQGEAAMQQAEKALKG